MLSNPRWLFATGVGLLALHPLIWLINTWISPAYQSNGFLVVLLVGGLFLWSVTSTGGRKFPDHFLVYSCIIKKNKYKMELLT